ncbi:MAG: hypothetical protein ACOX6S_10825 [Clostridia bacterium]
MSEHKKDKLQEFRDVMSTMSGTVPQLINKIIQTYYSPENAANMARSIGAFYKELVEAGIPEGKALRMAQNYTISFEKMTSSFKGCNPSFKGGKE